MKKTAAPARTRPIDAAWTRAQVATGRMSQQQVARMWQNDRDHSVDQLELELPLPEYQTPSASQLT